MVTKVGKKIMHMPFKKWGFPSDPAVKNRLPVLKRCGRHEFDPWVGKIPGGRNGNPFQYSSLENSMGRGAWWATVHVVSKSWTPLK